MGKIFEIDRATKPDWELGELYINCLNKGELARVFVETYNRDVSFPIENGIGFDKEKEVFINKGSMAERWSASSTEMHIEAQRKELLNTLSLMKAMFGKNTVMRGLKMIAGKFSCKDKSKGEIFVVQGHDGLLTSLIESGAITAVGFAFYEPSKLSVQAYNLAVKKQRNLQRPDHASISIKSDIELS